MKRKTYDKLGAVNISGMNDDDQDRARIHQMLVLLTFAPLCPILAINLPMHIIKWKKELSRKKIDAFSYFTWPPELRRKRYPTS
jgi:hypothetical protein